MSQFERSDYSAADPRRAARIPRQGIDESLNAPGLVVIPPVETQGQKAAAELSRALGLTAALVSEAGQTVRQIRLENKAEEALANRQERAAGFQGSQETIPDTIAKIKSGELRRPEGVPDDKTWIDQLVGSMTEGAGTEYVAGFRENAAPRIAEAIASRNESLRQSAVAESLNLTRQQAMGAGSSDQITQAVADAKKINPDLGDLEALSLIALPALNSAADSGDAERFDMAAKAIGGKLPGDVAAARRVLTQRQAANQRETQQRSIDGVYGLLNQRAYTAALDRLDRAGSTIAEDDKLRLREVVIGAERERHVQGLYGQMLDGVPASEIEKQVRAAADVPDTQLGHIPPQVGRQIIADATRREQVKLAESQVVAALAGANVNLTESQHGEAFVKLVGPEGAGFVNVDNRIVNPTGLADAVLGARILPTDLKQTMTQQLTSTDPLAVTNAASAIGRIAADPRLYADLVESSPVSVRPAIARAADMFKSGVFKDPAAAQAVGTNIQQTLQATAELPPNPLTEQMRQQIADTAGKDFLTQVPDTILKTIREEFPHAKDSLLGFDFLDPDPSLDTSGPEVRNMIRNAFGTEYVRLRSTLPETDARAAATKYAEGVVRNKVDFVRWGGKVAAVRVDTGQGLRMPEGLRWGDEFETEAKADLKTLGIDPDTVVPAPFLSPAFKPGTNPEAEMGWIFMDRATGYPLTDEKGNIRRFRPSDRAAQRNAEFRRLLDDKEARFGSKPIGELDTAALVVPPPIKAGTSKREILFGKK